MPANGDKTDQIKCDLGRYAPAPGFEECLDCAVGTFARGTGSEECTKAAAGSFVNESGAFEEKECKAGTYTEAKGQSTCLPAKPGEYVPEDGWSNSPEKCKPGKTSGPEADACDDCPSGSYARLRGSSSCTPAQKGYYVSENGDRTEEIPCEMGYYSPGSGANTCVKCSPGTYTDAKAQSVCKKALPGECVACAGIKTSCHRASFFTPSTRRLLDGVIDAIDSLRWADGVAARV